MAAWKIKLKYLMFKFGLRPTIPAQIINQIKIEENNEELVDVSTEPVFCFSDSLKNEPVILLRHTVVQKLKEASKELPPNLKFKIYYAYRSLNTQKQLWQERLEYNR